MTLTRTHKMYIISSIMLALLIAAYFSITMKKLYGNDEASIVQVIQSIEGYSSDSIELLEIKDINDNRIVGFLINSNPAYIHFIKNPKGNYEWAYAEKSEGESFAHYFISFMDDQSSGKSLMIITNHENEIAKMELEVNKRVLEKEFRVNQSSVTWIPIAETDENSYSLSYKYFDINGNLIEET